MDYNQMNYNQMQYQPQMSLQTPEQKQTGMFLHLSQLINLILPFGGIIAPILIWQLKKEEIPALDAHGKMVVNWIISSLIYWVVSGILGIYDDTSNNTGKNKKFNRRRIDRESNWRAGRRF
jgi:uncharacterized Tic20 family protein